MAIVSHTCQSGGGDVDAMRIIIASVLTGGMKLSAMANVVLGSRATGGDEQPRHHQHQHHRRHSACASRISLTAAPMAPKTEANRK